MNWFCKRRILTQVKRTEMSPQHVWGHQNIPYYFDTIPGFSIRAFKARFIAIPSYYIELRKIGYDKLYGRIFGRHAAEIYTIMEQHAHKK